MTTNPFGEPDTQSTHRHYLMLVSASKDNMKAAQQIVDNVKKSIDRNAHPLWIDSRGIGLFIAADVTAGEIRSAAFEGVVGDFTDIKDTLILQIGADWYARDAAPFNNWLAAHVGPPLAPAPDSRQRRRKNERK